MRLYLSSFRVGRRPDELLRLLGGRTRAAVIANAVDFKGAGERAESVARELSDLAALGLDPVEVDLRAYFDGGMAPHALDEFDLLWVRGGNAFILRRALRLSGADEIVLRLLADDVLVYAGYSAGPVILGESLRGFERVDPADVVPAGYPPATPIWEGLGVLPYAVVPHYKSDHPESAAIDDVIDALVAGDVEFVTLRDGDVIVRDGASETILS